MMKLSALTVLPFAILLVMAGCFPRPVPILRPEDERSEIRLTEMPSARGIFIVVHGLNQRPSSMEPLCAVVRQQGFHTYRLSLTGHTQRGIGTWEASRWKDDLTTAYWRARFQFPNLPIHILTYSLGGLLATLVVDRDPSITPASMILFAPPLSLRPLPRTGYFLLPLPPMGFSVQNLAPGSYRRYSSTPLFWYRNILSLYDESRRVRSRERLAAIPTLVVLHQGDELVSFDGVEEWIDNNGLSATWKTISVQPVPEDPTSPAHLFLDQASLGEQEWTRLQNSLAEFITSVGKP